MKKSRAKPFTDVDFLRQYPAGDVAEHEIFMSFNGDSQAVAFYEWWNEKGCFLFAEYLEKKEK